jgi:hypothetical protein
MSSGSGDAQLGRGCFTPARRALVPRFLQAVCNVCRGLRLRGAGNQPLARSHGSGGRHPRLAPRHPWNFFDPVAITCDSLALPESAPGHFKRAGSQRR